MKVEAFVLAGGKSSRMGRDKGLVEIQGKPMIWYILENLKTVGVPTKFIANNEAYEAFGVPVFEDMKREKGPMGGLYTALKNTEAEVVLLTSCDMPLIPMKAIKGLLSLADKERIIAVTVGERINPLFATYPVNLLPAVEQKITAGKLKMTDFILENKHTLVPSIDWGKPWAFQNINDEAELRKLEKEWNR